LIGGVDEAGRGSVIGPLIIAGVSVKSENIASLHKAGVKDSKLLTLKGRQRLLSQIVDLAEHICLFKSDCGEVDQYVSSNMLNKLEAEAMAVVIDNIYAGKVYIDSCDVNPIRYRQCIECRLTSVLKPKIFSIHHADRINTVVSAASIIAKVIRDQEIQKIRSKYNQLGSGYPCDHKTMKFITDWIIKYNSAPSFARRSWKPLKVILKQDTHDTSTKLSSRDEEYMWHGLKHDLYQKVRD
jgi:ribonuclease HII